MFDTLDRIFLAGLGAMSMTKEKAEHIFDEYVQKGKVSREQQTGFVKEVMDHAEKTRKDMEKLVSDEVNKALTNMGVLTKQDLDVIMAKLDAIEQKLSQ